MAVRSLFPVQASGDTLKFVGVFAGCEYVSSTTGKKVFSNYWPGSGADTNFDIIGFVYDNPMQRFHNLLRCLSHR